MLGAALDPPAISDLETIGTRESIWSTSQSCPVLPLYIPDPDLPLPCHALLTWLFPTPPVKSLSSYWLFKVGEKVP